MSTYKRMKIDPYISLCTKLKSRWIKDCNINLDTLNLTKEKMRNNLKFIGIEDNFLNRTPIVSADTKVTINGTS